MGERESEWATGKIVERKPGTTYGPHQLNLEAFQRLAVVCSIARYIKRAFKLPTSTAKMIADEAIKHAENQATDEI